MTRLNVKFRDGTMVTVNDDGTIQRSDDEQPIRADLPSMIISEMNPDPDTIYAVSSKRVGSALDIHVDDAMFISYKQLGLYIRRLYRKSKIDPLKSVFDELLSSPDISSFERRLRDIEIDDTTFVTIKTYLLTVIAYYRSGGMDVHYLNIKNLGEMTDALSTLREMIFVESFFSTTSIRDKRTPMMTSIIIETYREIRSMNDEKLQGYIMAHEDDIRSKVATFLRDTFIFSDRTP